MEVYANSYEAPAGINRPVNAYVVSDCDGDCEEAAARAVETVWQAVSVQGKRLKPLVLGFDLPGRKANRPVVGASGGLAFVVSAMQKFSGCDCGPIAATGILQSTDVDAPLLEVRSIVEKLKAALELIPPGGLVLYPESNDPQVPATLKSVFEEKKIRLRCVRDVSHVLEIIMDDISEEKHDQNGLPKWILATACMLLVALLVTAGMYWQREKDSVSPLPVVLNPEKTIPTGSQQEVTEAPGAESNPLPSTMIQGTTPAIGDSEQGTFHRKGSEMAESSEPDSKGIESEELAENPEVEQTMQRPEKSAEVSIQPSKGFD